MAPPPPAAATASSTGTTKKTTTTKKKIKKGTKKGLTNRNNVNRSSSSTTVKIKPFARPPALPIQFYPRSVRKLQRASDCVLHRSPLYDDDDDDAEEANEERYPRAPESPTSITDEAAAGSVVGTGTGDKSNKAGVHHHPNKGTNNRTPVSREELYRTVETLCLHKFGPDLYRDVLRMLDDAASRVLLGRLVLGLDGPSSRSSVPSKTTGASTASGAAAAADADAAAPGGGGSAEEEDRRSGGGATAASAATYSDALRRVTFPASTTSTGTATGGNSSSNHDAASRHNFRLLSNLHSAAAHYLEYLDVMRGIFMALDRMYVYHPPPVVTLAATATTSFGGANLEEEKWWLNGTVTSRSSTGGGGSGVSGASASSATARTGSGLGAGGGGGGGGGGGPAWGLWECGIAVLRRRMTLPPSSLTLNLDLAKPTDATMMMDVDGEEAGAANNAAGGSSASAVEEESHRSSRAGVLRTLLELTASSLLLEYTGYDVDRTLVRNCVRIVSDLDALRDFTVELTMRATDVLDEEGQEWSRTCLEGADANGGSAVVKDVTPTALTGGGGVDDSAAAAVAAAADGRGSSAAAQATSAASGEGAGGGGGGGGASAFLRHVEHRLRQSASLSSYYLPSTVVSSFGTSTATSSAAGGGVARAYGLVPIDASHRPPRSSTTASAAGALPPPPVVVPSQPHRLLPSLVESRLLAPRLRESALFHPRRLRPILDDPTRVVPDAKRLYHLCRRIPGGSDKLRVAFGKYGRDKGRSIVHAGRLAQRKMKKGVASSAATVKELDKRVVPNLLSFQNHLTQLHVLAFHSDDAYGTTIRSVWEDVLNSPPPPVANSGESDENGMDVEQQQGGDDGDDGAGGSRVAELLARHVDVRFKSAKAQASPAAGPSSVVASMMAAGGGGVVGSSFNATATGITAAGATAAAAAPIDEDPNESYQRSILGLFRHVHSKDVFEAFYKRDFAKRLLLNKSTSYDLERSFLSKLKAECGSGYTSKMEGMFKDVELSRDVMASYAAYLAGQKRDGGGGAGSADGTASTAASSSAAADASSSLSVDDAGAADAVDMDVQVLTTGYWPVYPQHANLILPPSLLAHRSRFESYYRTKYQGRRVAWQYALGNCVVRARFPKIPGGAVRELIVSLCQALVLLCFNGTEGDAGLTIVDVMKQTGIDDRGEAERVLQSLSLGRDGTRVLTKIDRDDDDDDNNNSGDAATQGSAASEGAAKKKPPRKVRRSVSDRDAFVFNASFTSNQRRIKITNVQMKETVEERSKTREAVSRDRLYLIDAAVVRIMKARKTLEHRALMGEVLNQLKFPATSTDVKKRVESLIEREYMERCEGDRSRYNYLA